MARTTGTPRPLSSGGCLLIIPPGAVSTAAYVLGLIAEVRPFIVIAKRVWRNGAPQELRDRLMFQVIRFVAYRELRTCTSHFVDDFRTIALSVAAELRVREARAARTINNVIDWVCDADNNAYVSDKRSDHLSHAEEVAAGAQKEFVREAAPKLRAERSMTYRQVAHHIHIPLATVWRAVREADQDGDPPKPRRWSNHEISTLEETMETMCTRGGKSIREVCEVVAGKLHLKPATVRQFWYRRQRTHR